jgi:predicted AAA+ superfamily ATPase
LPDYLPRALEPLLLRTAALFPSVLLTGPRQCGKTTLLRHLFDASHRYVSLDLPETEDLAARDPRLFLDRHPPPLIVDEVQRVPSLFRYLKDRIDRDRDRYGQFLLTGSQSLPLMSGVTESLAGRIALLELGPMSLDEQSGQGTAWSLPPNPGVRPVPAGSATRLATRMLRGGFPELVARPEMESSLWFESYLQTYLERDVRQLRQVGDLRDFRRLMISLAARTGQLLNLSDVARDLGIAVNTVKAWVSVLEAGRQLALVSPFARNLSKRLVKSPKVYFADTGLLCHLLGLRDTSSVLSGAIGGPIFENLVHAELVQAFRIRGQSPSITFFRSSDGLEVDFLLELQGRLHPIEVKRSATPRPEMADGIRRLRTLLGDQLEPGLVVMLGDQDRFPLARDCIGVGLEGMG